MKNTDRWGFEFFVFVLNLIAFVNLQHQNEKNYLIFYVIGLLQQHFQEHLSTFPKSGVVLQGKRSHSNISQSHFQMHNGTDKAPGKSVLSAASSLGDSIMLVFALCFHSVFEGIAIGVETTEGKAWKALWTITLHKIFAAIAMGIAVLRMIPDRPFVSCVAYAFPFAISSPIGVAIGIIIDATAQGHVADWISGISMGLACGVFIYVSIKHLSTKGYFPQKPVSVDTPFYKFLAVSLGIGVIAVLMIWDD